MLDLIVWIGPLWLIGAFVGAVLIGKGLKMLNEGR